MSNLQHFQKREKTSIRKSYHGWNGNTTMQVNGQDWAISTMKRSNGAIMSFAQAVKGQGNGDFIFSPFHDKSITLHTVKGNATEQAIKTAHYEALAKFDLLNEAGELPENRVFEIKRGQLFRFDGYGHSMALKYVVYDLKTDNWGTHYKCVDLIERCFRIVDRPRPVTEKFGIGVYYNEGETMAEDELNNLVIEVAEVEKQRQADKYDREQKAIIARAEAIERGKAILSTLPDGVKAIIVGELMEDDSDPMTDYFASHCVKTVYLGFSTHTRDLFKEMKEAAVNFEETKELREAEEHREKYTGGGGYYIGGRRNGWRISKEPITNNADILEKLQLAAGEGRYFIPACKVHTACDIVTSDLKLIDYSEKAFAITGDTKPIKDQLKTLGGKWNSHLTCGPGWIFSKRYLDAVKQAFQL